MQNTVKLRISLSKLQDTNTNICFPRVQLTAMGQELAKNYQVATTEDGLVTQEDWRSLRSTIDYSDGR